MAEAALAILGSISAVTTIATTVGKVSLKIHDIAQHAGAARSEIEAFGLDIRQFSSELLIVQESLGYHCRMKGSARVCKWVEEHHVVAQVMNKADRVKKRLKRIARNLRTFKDTINWVCRIKWRVQKKVVQALHLEMDSVKLSLNLVLGTMKFDEAAQVNPQSREVERLRIQIRGLQNAMVFLKKQLSECDSDLLDEPIKSNKTNQALIGLADSITSRGTIPSSSHSSRRGSSHVSPAPLNTKVNTRPVREKSVPPTGRKSDLVSDTSRAPKVTFRHSYDSKGASSSRRKKSRPSGRGSSLSGSSTSEDDRDNRSDASDDESDDESDDDVRPTSYILHLRQGDNIQNINGYINDRQVTTILDQELDVNIISQAFASKHGIKVEPLEKETTFSMGRGRFERKMGNAVFTWDEGYRRSRSITVHCAVTRHEIRPIILGRPFIEKRTQRWS